MPRPPSTRCSAKHRRAPTRSRPRYAGKVASLDGPGLIAAMQELAEIEEIAGRAGTYAHLSFSVDTADPAFGALLQRVEEKGTAIETALLFFHLEWAALDDDARRGAARHRRARLRPPSPRHGAPLPAASAQRAGGEDPHREGAERALGLGAAVRGADGGDRRRPPGRRRARGAWTSRSRASSTATARCASDDRRGGHRGAAARPAHARLHVQHAARGQDDRRPAAPLPALACVAQPVQRGLRRVRAGADRGGARTLRAAAPLVSPEGAAARHRQARGLRPHGGGDAGQREGRRGRTPSGSCSTPTRRFSRRARRAGRALLRRELDRRAGAARQARRRVLLLRRAERAPVRAAQLHVPAPRRADAGARARAWRARRARRQAGRLPHGDAADAGRDRVGVRRDARVRPAAGRGAVGRVAPVAAGASRSRARSRRSSARSR